MTPGAELRQSLNHPLLSRSSLTFTETFYPLGFPLRIATNSVAVLEAAQESWGSFDREFDRTRAEIRVLVSGGENTAIGDPSYRLEEHLLMIVSGRDDFAVCDCRARFGCCFASSALVADRSRFRWYFLDAIGYTLLMQDDVAGVHAACVARDGRGALLCGPSGAGKSTLAYACARSGWAYVADDATMLLQQSAQREAIGKPHYFRFRPEAARLFPELQEHSARTRPNGKLRLEVPASALPRIQTASRCQIASVVFLNRQSGESAQARRIRSWEAVVRLQNELPPYAPDVRRRHAETIAALHAAPAYELRYDALPDAVDLLAGLEQA